MMIRQLISRVKAHRTLKTGAAIVVIAGVAACASLMERDPDVYHLLPRESDLPGWEIVDGPRSFDTTNMALYMEADSELLREYRALGVATALYRPLGDRPGTVTVWVYRLGSPLEAFGFYGRKTATIPRIPAPSMGSHEITAFRNGLLLRKGAHFVSIVTDGPEAGGELVMFARSILEAIPPSESGVPDWAKLFGEGGRKDEIVYYPKGIYGIPLGAGMFVRRRMIKGTAYEVYYSRRPSVASALRDFTGLLDGERGGFTLASSGERQVAFRIRSDGGYVFAARSGDTVFGLLWAETLTDGNGAIDALMDEISGAGND
ncbi:MAG: hypothetical protein KBA15_00445 [Spirochaetes bacterium]|jgi:hypothetical protein|nr:hypothetical protein [Spirochaetota bacterium]